MKKNRVKKQEERLLILGLISAILFVMGYLIHIIFFYLFLVAIAAFFIMLLFFWHCPYCGRHIWFNLDKPCLRCGREIFTMPDNELKNTQEETGFFKW